MTLEAIGGVLQLIAIVAVFLLLPIALIALVSAMCSRRFWMRCLLTGLPMAAAAVWGIGWQLNTFSSDEDGTVVTTTMRVLSSLPFVAAVFIDTLIAVYIAGKRLDE